MKEIRLKAFGQTISAWRNEDGLIKHGMLAAAIEDTGLLSPPILTEYKRERFLDKIRKWQDGKAWPNESDRRALRRALRADPDDPTPDRINWQRVKKWSDFFNDSNNYYNDVLAAERELAVKSLFVEENLRDVGNVQHERDRLQASFYLNYIIGICRNPREIALQQRYDMIYQSFLSVTQIGGVLDQRLINYLLELVATCTLDEVRDENRQILIEIGFGLSRASRAVRVPVEDIFCILEENDKIACIKALLNVGAYCLSPSVPYEPEYLNYIWPLITKCAQAAVFADVRGEIAAYNLFHFAKAYTMQWADDALTKRFADARYELVSIILHAETRPLAVFWLGSVAGKYAKGFEIKELDYMHEWALLADGKRDRASIPKPSDLTEAYDLLSDKFQEYGHYKKAIFDKFINSKNKYVRSGIALLDMRRNTPHRTYMTTIARLCVDRHMARWASIEVLEYLVHWNPRRAERILCGILVRAKRWEAGEAQHPPLFEKRIAFLALLAVGGRRTLRALFTQAEVVAGYRPGSVAYAMSSGEGWLPFAVFALPWWRSWSHFRGVAWALGQLIMHIYIRRPFMLVKNIFEISFYLVEDVIKKVKKISSRWMEK